MSLYFSTKEPTAKRKEEHTQHIENLSTKGKKEKAHLMVGTEPTPNPPVPTEISSNGMVAPDSSPRLNLSSLPSSADPSWPWPNLCLACPTTRSLPSTQRQGTGMSGFRNEIFLASG